MTLLTGCTLPFAPDVTPTPSSSQVVADGTSNMATTAFSDVALTAQASPLETPTLESSTPIPTAEPTAVPPTPAITVPAAATTQPTTGPTTSAVVPTTQPVASGPQSYIVQPGDTLYSIARRYGMGFEDLAAHNGIINPNQIQIGQVISIPSGAPTDPVQTGEVLYTVRVGDNLFRIALRYNVSYIYLASYNGISNPHLIRVGQVIHIPPGQ